MVLRLRDRTNNQASKKLSMELLLRIILFLRLVFRKCSNTIKTCYSAIMFIFLRSSTYTKEVIIKIFLSPFKIQNKNFNYLVGFRLNQKTELE